jgi:hypothetical protein
MTKQYFETRKNSLEDSVKNIFGETLTKDNKDFTKALESAKETGQKFFSVNGTQYSTNEQWGANKVGGGKVGIKANVKKPKTEDNTNNKSDDGEGLDKAKPDAAKKKFADRKDKDIDNDGDTDSSDKFLHKKRAAITKAVEKEKESVKEYVKTDGTNKRVSEGDKRRTENNKDLEEASFAVKITDLPLFHIDSSSAGKVKAGLKKALRNPKSIESVERVSKSEVKKALRDKLAGKDNEDEKEEQWGANKVGGGKVGIKASKLKKNHESIVDIQNKKNISVREALAKIWGVSEDKSFNPFKSNTKEAQVPKTKREKTESGQKQTKVELNPDIAAAVQTQIRVQ